MVEEMLSVQEEIASSKKKAALTTPSFTETKPVVIKSKKELAEEKLYELWKKDSQTVRGIFRNHEIPNSSISFTYHRYKYDSPEKYTFADGQTYEVSRGLARHINEDCNYPIHKYLVDENNKPSMLVGRKVQRFSFMPTDFSDIDVKPDIAIAKPL